jgi:hypothetical protein
MSGIDNTGFIIDVKRGSEMGDYVFEAGQQSMFKLLGHGHTGDFSLFPHYSGAGGLLEFRENINIFRIVFKIIPNFGGIKLDKDQ